MALYKQGDTATLEITGFGMEGEGVAHKDGFTFFVPFAIKDEIVKARVTYVKRSIVFAELTEVLTPSKSRVTPVCNRFARCGGCDLMHISYPEQLNIKRDNLVGLLHKNAGVDFPVDETVPCSSPLYYRNKIQIPFGTVNGKVAVGFYRENSHKIASVTKCFLHGEWVEKLIKAVLTYAEETRLTAYDDITQKGVLRHMVARKTDDGYCIVIVTNGALLPDTDKLIELFTEAVGDCFSLYLSKKEKHDNVVMGKSVIPLKQRETFVDVLGVKFSINPFSFLQLNDEIRDKIYTRVIDGITAESDSPVVIDAYAGVGVLGAVLAKRGARVYNVEIVPEATEDADRLVKENGLSDKVTNINGDAAVELPKIFSSLYGVDVPTSEHSDAALKSAPQGLPSVILDPPRKGCDARVLDALVSLAVPNDVYYLSCNPATLTRDLKILLSGGYTLLSVTPYDMFPQTKHVETLILLCRK